MNGACPEVSSSTALAVASLISGGHLIKIFTKFLALYERRNPLLWALSLQVFLLISI